MNYVLILLIFLFNVLAPIDASAVLLKMLILSYINLNIFFALKEKQNIQLVNWIRVTYAILFAIFFKKNCTGTVFFFKWTNPAELKKKRNPYHMANS